MKAVERHLSRRDLLGTLGVAGAGIAGEKRLRLSPGLGQTRTGTRLVLM